MSRRPPGRGWSGRGSLQRGEFIVAERPAGTLVVRARPYPSGRARTTELRSGLASSHETVQRGRFHAIGRSHRPAGTAAAGVSAQASRLDTANQEPYGGSEAVPAEAGDRTSVARAPTSMFMLRSRIVTEELHQGRSAVSMLAPWLRSPRAATSRARYAMRLSGIASCTHRGSRERPGATPSLGDAGSTAPGGTSATGIEPGTAKSPKQSSPGRSRPSEAKALGRFSPCTAARASSSTASTKVE